MDNTLEKWALQHEAPISVHLTTSGTPADAAFDDFCRELMVAVPHLEVTTTTDTDKALPEIQVMDNVIFSVLPHDRLMAPFLKAMEYALGAEPSLEPSVRETLALVSVPSRARLYIAATCPHCPGVLARMIDLSAACPRVRLHVVEGTRFPEIAAQDHVHSAPCLILDDDFRWTGSVSLEEVADRMARREPATLSTDSLRAILERGDADWIARQMQAHGTLFPHFTELVVHDIWSVRLGAMVVIETLVEADPDLARQLVDPLLSRFEAADVTVKGDILYALGEAGGPSVVAQIDRLEKNMDDPQLKEAAADAIQRIREREFPSAAAPGQ